MPIASDFRIDATTKKIVYTGTGHGVAAAGYYSVLELHRWLQDLADDAGSTGDDYMDISRQTPSEKAYDTIIELVNGYALDETSLAHEHLYGGSITQDDGDTIYDGIAVIAGEGCNVQIIQGGLRLTNDFWNSTPSGASASGLNPDLGNGVAMRFMLKVRASGADIDGRRLLMQTRVLGYTYSEFKINGTGRGVNVAALTYLTDLNNQTASGTIAGWTDITNLTEGYNGLVVDGTNTQYFYSQWTKGAKSISQLYERMKYIARRGSAETLYGLNGELFRGVTHQVTYTSLAGGTFADSTAVSWGTGATAGTGQILADNGSTTMWIQQLTGAAPVNALTLTQGGVTATVNVVTERTTPGAQALPFCGQSTGTAIIGAYGFGVKVSDLAVADKLFDLSNNPATPQNLVTFTVTDLVAGEDYVLVGPAAAGVLDEDQFTLNGALTGAAVTSVVVTEAIPADTPTSGKLRIKRANGAWSLHPYSAYNAGTKTFTITSHDFSSNNASNGAFAYLAYIDELIGSGTTLSFQTNYSSDRSLFVRRRFAGTGPTYSDSTKTYEGTATLGAAGGSVAVQRLTDA